MDRKRVHPFRKLTGKDGVDEAVTLNAALAGKGRSDDRDPEMRFTARPRSRVAGVKMRLVDNAQALGCERSQELFLKYHFDRHDAATFPVSDYAPLRLQRAECILPP